MPTTSLPTRPAKHFIEEVLRKQWDPSQVRGYDVTVDNLSNDATLVDATTIDNVGAIYPSLIVTDSQPGTSGGATTYDFLTNKGPGQNRTGTLLATVRAEERDADDYVGDSATYSGADAQTIVEELATHVEDICIETSLGGASEFSLLGAQRPADIPDDTDPEDGRTVRLAQVEIRFGNVRAIQ